MSDAAGWKCPPAGVASEAEPDRPYVPLSEAAQRLGVDRRTLLRALTSGATAGWARPGPDNLRWFVYSDTFSAAQPVPDAVSRDEGTSGAERDRIARLEAENADLRARLSNASATSLLLIAAQEDLNASAELLSKASDKYRQALSLYMTPDNLAELSSDA